MTALIVHTSPTCGRCKTLLNLMNKREIDYTTVDITTDPEAHDRLAELGYTELPVTLHYDETGKLIDHWCGYNPTKLTA